MKWKKNNYIIIKKTASVICLLLVLFSCRQAGRMTILRTQNKKWTLKFLCPPRKSESPLFMNTPPGYFNTPCPPFTKIFSKNLPPLQKGGAGHYGGSTSTSITLCHSNIHRIHPSNINVVKPIPAKVQAPKKGTKSPNLGKREFSDEIGRRHFFPLVVNYLHAKNQRNSWTSFRENRVTN